MRLPRNLIAQVDASLAECQAASLPMDGLGEVATVALGLARGDRDVARTLILNDFEEWLARTGRLNSSYHFSNYPEFREGKRRAHLFGALAWTYLLPARSLSLQQYA